VEAYLLWGSLAGRAADVAGTGTGAAGGTRTMHRLDRFPADVLLAGC
jgi:hypothetical protein